MIDSENFSSLSSPTHKLQFSTKWMPRCRISRLFNPQQGECGRPGTKPSNISYYNLFSKWPSTAKRGFSLRDTGVVYDQSGWSSLCKQICLHSDLPYCRSFCVSLSFFYGWLAHSPTDLFSRASPGVFALSASRPDNSSWLRSIRRMWGACRYNCIHFVNVSLSFMIKLVCFFLNSEARSRKTHEQN
jgi:hypothetical protein